MRPRPRAPRRGGGKRPRAHPRPPGTIPDPSQAECLECPIDETLHFDDYEAECDWVVSRFLANAGTSCADDHTYVVDGLLGMPPTKDVTIHVRTAANEAICAGLTGRLVVVSDRSWFQPTYPFYPTWTLAGGCDLHVEAEINNWLLSLGGADAVRLEVTTNYPVTLSVSSGPACIVLPY